LLARKEETARRLVHDHTEWRYHRQAHGIHVGVEKSMFNMLSETSAEIFLHKEETISIPFVYQSMLSGTVGRVEPHAAEEGPHQLREAGMSSKNIHVSHLPLPIVWRMLHV
jgi:hypothetical protein